MQAPLATLSSVLIISSHLDELKSVPVSCSSIKAPKAHCSHMLDSTPLSLPHLISTHLDAVEERALDSSIV